MKVYSAETEVLWIEASGMRRPDLTRMHDIRRSASRLRRALRPAEPAGTHAGLHVTSPFLLPLPGNALASWINGRVIRSSIRRAAARLEWRRPPLMWVFTPTVSGWLETVPHSGVIYHCVDRWWAFSEYDPDVMRAHHDRLCRLADVVFASSEALFDDCRALTDRVYLAPHGVDWDHFAPAALRPPAVPGDIADVKGPVIGFFGLLHDWVDLQLIRAVARRFADATVVLIGQVRVPLGDLADLPNVRVLGPRTYEQLPAYCAAFDVALLPFVLNDLTAAVNPVKLWEYLSAGVPTVATALPELGSVAGRDGVYVAGTATEFVDAVGKALQRGRDPQGRRQRALAMAPYAWPVRCADMAHHVRRSIESRS
jgi:glycosyltransferase involved in cell wall biosynthesis